MEPTWRPIPGYEGYYEVSHTGLVRSLDRTITATLNGVVRYRQLKGRLLSQRPDPSDGYCRIILTREGGIRDPWRVHRAVLMAFEGAPPADKMQCCHRDGNPTNNHISNLYWGTASQNVQDALRHGTHSQIRKTHCPQGHPYDAENTRYCNTKGSVFRVCGICRKAAKAKWERSHQQKGVLSS